MGLEIDARTVPSVPTLDTISSSLPKYRLFGIPQVKAFLYIPLFSTTSTRSPPPIRSAAQESTRLQDEYTAALDAQQSARAANGLANSYTVQQIMQDSRWNLLTDQQTLRQNTADQLYETNLSALLGVQAKKDEASQYRTLSRRTSGSFLTQYLQRLFNGFSN